MDVDSTKRAQEANKADLRENADDYGRLELELGLAPAAISRCERFMRDFVCRVCTGYIRVVRAQSVSYQDRPIAALGDAKAHG